jgi:hypothetical protein
MAGTFVFVHGIGDQDHAENRARILTQLGRHEAFAGFEYAAVEWDHLAPADLDVSSALPGPGAAAGTPDAGEAWEGVADDLHDKKESIPDFFENVALNWLTDRLLEHRAGLTNGLTDLIRDLLFYLKRGIEIRRLVRDTLLGVDLGKPVVLFGHSLGGVACVDIMGDPRPTVKGIRVDLLVTAGSQAPWLYLMDSLELLRPGDPDAVAFSPWLNFFDRRDFLSFVAHEVFGASPVPPTDFETVSGLPFPASHGSYLDSPTIYDHVASRLAELTLP